MIRRPDFVSILAAASIVVALGVMALKYVAYLKTGSVALYSDALESIVNVTTAVVALYTVRLAGKPADANHPFGHHKAEYFSAVLSGALIIVAALLILEEVWRALRNPTPLRAPLEGFIWSGTATVINAAWAGVLIWFGTRLRSPALAADGWHVLTDAVTSVGALIGFGLVAATGWQILDPLTAALVAVNILRSGWVVMRDSVSGLMDESVDARILAEIRKSISDQGVGAIEAHDLKTRHAGRATFIEFHLVVPGDMPVRAAHEICDRIEIALKAAVEGAHVLIHVEPEEKAKHTGIVVV